MPGIGVMPILGILLRNYRSNAPPFRVLQRYDLRSFECPGLFIKLGEIAYGGRNRRCDLHRDALRPSMRGHFLLDPAPRRGELTPEFRRSRFLFLPWMRSVSGVCHHFNVGT